LGCDTIVKMWITSITFLILGIGDSLGDVPPSFTNGSSTTPDSINGELLPLLITESCLIKWTGDPGKLPVTVTYIAIGGGGGTGSMGGSGSGYLALGDFDLYRDEVQVTIGEAGGRMEGGGDTFISPPSLPNDIIAKGGKIRFDGPGADGWSGGGGGTPYPFSGNGGSGGSNGHESGGMDLGGTRGGHGQGIPLPSVTLEQGDLRPGSGGKGAILNVMGSGGGGGGFCVDDNFVRWAGHAGEGFGGGGSFNAHGNRGAVILYIT